MIRRPPRSTQSRSSAASDVYKRQVSTQSTGGAPLQRSAHAKHPDQNEKVGAHGAAPCVLACGGYTHDRAIVKSSPSIGGWAEGSSSAAATMRCFSTRQS
eukprot:TRINITY_DN3641_c0_g1_i3.p1 TRINITY_DN3641_c0_g1~~TRINITY_DN3641_c0_g1_i3.p1  ORF type:complete len:100 (+),score=44.16 TRINITY_DN3641_c0_g1_i3:140-439(+)